MRSLGAELEGGQESLCPLCFQQNQPKKIQRRGKYPKLQMSTCPLYTTYLYKYIGANMEDKVNQPTLHN